MPDKIRMRRGNKANLPMLDDGEFGLVEDTTPKEVYIGTTGGNQKLVSVSPTIAPWIAPTLLNSWVNYGGTVSTSGYYKDDLQMVRLRGVIKSGVVTAGTIIFTLPVGYRPSQDTTLGCVTNNGTSDVIGRINIEAITGNVKIFGGGNTLLSLDGLLFRAEQ